MRLAVTALLALSVALPLAHARAEPRDGHEQIHQFFNALEGLTERLADQTTQSATQAREAIVAGGAIIAQNRNTLSGGALGCALGALAAGGSAAVLGVQSGGATATAAPDAVLAGCALGALGGASLGYQLDHPAGR